MEALRDCDGCGRVTKTIAGRCPECGYVKDEAWLPPARREGLGFSWPDDRLVAGLAGCALAIVLTALFQALT